MSATSGTPDYQRGVVSAQKLLATVAAGQASVNVAVPPNCETLAVCLPGALNTYTAQCVGLTSDYAYPGVSIPTQGTTITSQTFYFDVSSPVDSEVNINISSAFGQSWYVYADAGVHVVVDAAAASATATATRIAPPGLLVVGGERAGYAFPIYVDNYGSQHTALVPPGQASTDHPSNELKSVAFDNATNGTVIVAAAGATARIRVFSAELALTTGGTAAALIDSSTSGPFLWSRTASGQSPAHLNAYPSGITLTQNAGIVLDTFSANGTGNVVYTIEQV